MTTNHPILLSVCIAVLAGFFSGLTVHELTPAPAAQVQQVGSPTGSTFNTAKIAMINWTIAAVSGSNGSATTTSLYNGDSSDRIIQSVQFDCASVGTSKTAYTGAGLANLIFTAATTSSSAPAAITNANVVLSTSVSTSSTELYVSTTTPGLTGSAFVRRWASGSYLTFASNATNTAACTIGVSYFGI